MLGLETLFGSVNDSINQTAYRFQQRADAGLGILTAYLGRYYRLLWFVGVGLLVIAGIALALKLYEVRLARQVRTLLADIIVGNRVTAERYADDGTAAAPATTKQQDPFAAGSLFHQQ